MATPGSVQLGEFELSQVAAHFPNAFSPSRASIMIARGREMLPPFLVIQSSTAVAGQLLYTAGWHRS